MRPASESHILMQSARLIVRYPSVQDRRPYGISLNKFQVHATGINMLSSLCLNPRPRLANVTRMRQKLVNTYPPHQVDGKRNIYFQNRGEEGLKAEERGDGKEAPSGCVPLESLQR